MNNYIHLFVFFIVLGAAVIGLFYLIFWLIMEAEELINNGRNKLFPLEDDYE